MTITLLIIFIVGYVLIAAEHVTKINKSAVAMLLAVAGWIVVGKDGFEDYVPFIANISLFMLATISIVDVLNANGCFDFLSNWFRLRNGKLALWWIAGVTFMLSANLDNLTTTVLMLSVMNKIVANKRQRMYIGAAIVIAANSGGCFTVIGDYTTLMLWTKGAVTPTGFSGSLLIPALIATAIPVALISRKLPYRLEMVSNRFAFRGDDSLLPLWQRVAMFVVGIGGLWFIPTLHWLTDLPPFLGALCVLAVFWVLDEIINARRIKCELPENRMLPRSVQYEGVQTILFFIGVALAVSVLHKYGALETVGQWLDDYVHNVYIVSIGLGFLSAIMDNIALVMSSVDMYPVADAASNAAGIADSSYNFVVDGRYWDLIAYSAGVGSCLLPIGSAAGCVLMKITGTDVLWWVRNIAGKVLCGWLVGLGLYLLIDYLMD